MPYERALAHRLEIEPGSPDYETNALPTELSRLLEVPTFSSGKWSSVTAPPMPVSA